jgi:hypothetical protein
VWLGWLAIGRDELRERIVGGGSSALRRRHLIMVRIRQLVIALLRREWCHTDDGEVYLSAFCHSWIQLSSLRTVGAIRRKNFYGRLLKSGQTREDGN